MQAAIQLFVNASLFLLIFAVGVGSGSSDLAYVAQRPSLLVRAFVAVNIVVPACALLLCLAFSTMSHPMSLRPDTDAPAR